MTPEELKAEYEERFREAGYPATVEVAEDLRLVSVSFKGDTARHVLPLAEGFTKPAIPPYALGHSKEGQ